MRKTIKVVDAVSRANYFLANSAAVQNIERKAIATFVESMLHSADAYAGFRFTDGEQGERDDTRRQYFVPRALEDDLRAAIANQIQP